MRITEIKKIENHERAYQLIKNGKMKFECPILILHQATGFYWTRPLIVEGVDGDCLEYLMNELFNKYNDDEMPFPLYDIEEIEDIYLYEDYIPINGGEYYTNMISHVEKFD